MQLRKIPLSAEATELRDSIMCDGSGSILIPKTGGNYYVTPILSSIMYANNESTVSSHVFLAYSYANEEPLAPMTEGKPHCDWSPIATVSKADFPHELRQISYLYTHFLKANNDLFKRKPG